MHVFNCLLVHINLDLNFADKVCDYRFSKIANCSVVDTMDVMYLSFVIGYIILAIFQVVCEVVFKLASMSHFIQTAGV